MTDPIDTAKLRELLAAAGTWPDGPRKYGEDAEHYRCPACGGEGSLPGECVYELHAGLTGIQVFGIGDQMAAMEELLPLLVRSMPSILDRLDAQAEELAALRRNRAAAPDADDWAARAARARAALAAEVRVRELEHLLRKHAALCCDDCNGTGQYLGDDDRDGPCERCGGSGEVLPADVSAVLRPQDNNDMPASRGTTSGELLQLYDREENPDAYAVADSEGGEL